MEVSSKVATAFEMNFEMMMVYIDKEGYRKILEEKGLPAPEHVVDSRFLMAANFFRTHANVHGNSEAGDVLEQYGLR